MLAASNSVDPLLASKELSGDLAAHDEDTLPDMTNVSDNETDEEEDANAAWDQLMNRGNNLRQLRLLALADEREREAQNSADSFGCRNARDASCEEKKEESEETLPSYDSCNDVTTLHVEEMQDKVRILPGTNERVLDYGSYLAHQRYYDDLKHIDIKYMDFGNITNARGDSGGRLIVEQRKGLGKGGVCWDAGFVLGEHVVAHEHEWNDECSHVIGDGAAAVPTRPKIVELGAGTGLTGLMIAKATRSDVVITDLPELMGLMEDNVRRNFGGGTCDDIIDNSDALGTEELTTRNRKAKGTIASHVLRWGVEEDYPDTPYDVIVGADIVTSLYDPKALAQTLHALSGPGTRIYLSGKARLDKPHEEFDAEMERLFHRVEKIRRPSSRLRSPNVFVIVAEGKKPL